MLFNWCQFRYAQGGLFQEAMFLYTYLYRAEIDIQDTNKEIDRQSQRQMPIRHSYFLYLAVLTRESNLLVEKTSPKNSFFHLIGETHAWDAFFDLNCAKSCVSQCWFLYYGQTMDSSISVLWAAKTSKIFEKKKCNDNPLFWEFIITLSTPEEDTYQPWLATSWQQFTFSSHW